MVGAVALIDLGFENLNVLPSNLRPPQPSRTLLSVPFSMKGVSPPPQVIFVGFESQRQAPSQEHASSSSPEILQDTLC
jgi:hypothetical protein